MENRNYHGVVAGDIIASSELATDVRRELSDKMIEAYDEVRDAFGAETPYPLAISAGDEWRMYIEHPACALAVSMGFWTRLKARNLASRMVLAVGEIDFVENQDLHRADGPALRSAGRSLDAISETAAKFGLFVPVEQDPVARLWTETTGELTDILLGDLTVSQARAVAEMICGTYGSGGAPTRQEIADRWQPRPVTAQTISEHLQRARWPAIDRTLKRFEQFWKQ